MRTTLTFLFLNLFISLHAQYGSKVRSDVPGATLSPVTLGKGIFQMQHNYALIYLKNESNIHLFSNYLRYGITNRLEVDVILDYGISQITNDFAGYITTSRKSEVVGFNVGPRFNLFNQEKHNFNWTLIGTVELKKANRNNTLPDFNIISSLSWPLNNSEIGISARAYIIHNYLDIYRLTLKYSYFMNPRFLIFIEDALSFNSTFTINFLNLGLGYYINRDFILHLAGGIDMNQNSSFNNDRFDPNSLIIETGLSWRIRTNK